jgi:hypothetical protein
MLFFTLLTVTIAHATETTSVSVRSMAVLAETILMVRGKSPTEKFFNFRPKKNKILSIFYWWFPRTNTDNATSALTAQN